MDTIEKIKHEIALKVHYHRTKQKEYGKVEDYNNALYHQHMASAFEDSLIIIHMIILK